MTVLHDQDEVYEPFPEERRGSWGRRIFVVFVLLLVLGVVAVGAGWVVWQRAVDPPGEPGAEVKLTIPQGTSAQAIGALLEEQGVISSAAVWRWYLRLEGKSGFHAGQYTFRQDSSMDDVVAVLEKGPEVEYVTLTIPEGLTLKQIAERIGKLDGRSADTFLGLATSGEIRSRYQPEGVTTLEGLLFPETYNVEPKEDERAILQRLVGVMDDTAAGLGYDEAQAKVGLTPYETLIVASLIERETRVDDERPKVARVIYNRLAKKMPLQIDATVVYALGRSGTDTRVLLKDLEIDSPYNTYKIRGLPPTPIAVPGEASLRAAMNPEPGDWLYYVVTEKSGRHSFATTLSEHNRNIQKAEAAGLR